MKKIRLRSPAKINLYLKVLKKRPDGYHELETVFERISLFDDIVLIETKSRDIKIICDQKDIPTDGRNLVHKAVSLIQKKLNINKGVSINIKKKIPVAAGLAGGSSNAATVLMGLNRLWRLGLSRKQLAYFANQIGSDVAFFLHDVPFALGKGRGEIITPLNIKKKYWHVLVVPRLKLLTKDVYGALKLKLTKQKADVKILIRQLKKSELNVLSCLLTNDLEPAATLLCPKLKILKRRFQMHGVNALLSGSGPSIYALLDSKKRAQELAKKMAKSYSRVFVVSTV